MVFDVTANLLELVESSLIKGQSQFDPWEDANEATWLERSSGPAAKSF